MSPGRGQIQGICQILTTMNPGWKRYMPTEEFPFFSIVPIDDEHPIPHNLGSMECHCRPVVRTHDNETGEEYVHPLVIHSSFDGRELIEVAEKILGESP
jgi:hypothetical protein